MIGAPEMTAPLTSCPAVAGWWAGVPTGGVAGPAGCIMVTEEVA